ncbi:hypothetical protein C8A03DRAFT_29905 [Achaetomium macrosporum]|uniref:Uncharacterized protein n=1 Tax=Achaetomium macrosporum TaxID=79813 RepID=A0AAN7H9V0_9PEZI|nr:hypothetical protein C8A03DRAFT_29905 [Achaetomium macrosporum]
MKRVVLPTADNESHEGTQNHTTAPAPSIEDFPKEKTLPRRRQSPSPEFMEIVVPSLKVGAVAGACGLFTGAAAGIIRSAPPVLFSVIAGGQWFTLASSYYAARHVGLTYYWTAPEDKVKASTVAGGVAGTVAGLLRGPRNILPGALMFSLYGAGGQAFANWWAARAANAPAKSGGGFWSKWNPITKLSDQDYEKILEEQLLRVEADIAITDDRIKELVESDSRTKGQENLRAERSNPAPSGKE